jgi:hypothetical protein
MYTAMYLEKLLAYECDGDITLVNRENFFLCTPIDQPGLVTLFFLSTQIWL